MREEAPVARSGLSIRVPQRPRARTARRINCSSCCDLHGRSFTSRRGGVFKDGGYVSHPPSPSWSSRSACSLSSSPPSFPSSLRGMRPALHPAVSLVITGGLAPPRERAPFMPSGRASASRGRNSSERRRYHVDVSFVRSAEVKCAPIRMGATVSSPVLRARKRTSRYPARGSR